MWDALLFAAVETSRSYVWLLVEMLLVLAVIGVVGWLAVRALSGRAAVGAHVRVLGRQALEPRTSLYLLAVGRRVLLVGSGPSGPRTLAELDAADLEALGLSSEPPPAPEPPRGFREILAAKLRREP